MTAAGRPQRLNEVLPHVVRGLSQERGGPLPTAIELWPRVAGKRIAEQSRPTQLRQGCLTVTADNSAAVFELTARRQRLTEQLKRHWPTAPVTTMRIRLGDAGD